MPRTCWCAGWPGTCRGNSRIWCPAARKKQSSTTSTCSFYWQGWRSCSPTCTTSSGPLGCRNLRAQTHCWIQRQKSTAEWRGGEGGVTYSSPGAARGSRLASTARPGLCRYTCASWRSTGWPAGVWWSQCSDQWRWSGGWSWRLFQTRLRRKRRFYSLRRN